MLDKGARERLLRIRVQLNADHLQTFVDQLVHGRVLDRADCTRMSDYQTMIVRDCGELDGLVAEERGDDSLQQELTDRLIDEAEREPDPPGRRTPGERPGTKGK